MNTNLIMFLCIEGITAYAVYRLGVRVGKKSFNRNMCANMKEKLTPEEYKEFEELVDRAYIRTDFGDVV